MPLRIEARCADMSDTPSSWRFLYVLPNLELPEEPQENQVGEWPEGLDLRTSVFTITSGADPRVEAIRKEVPEVEQILSSFYRETGTRYVPAVLIGRADAPDRVLRSEEATVAFRNAVALSVVLRGRAAVARGLGGQAPTWSDTFDFHPAQLSASGRFVLLSPALRALIAMKKPRCFTRSPNLPVEGRRLWPDEYLYRTLGLEWARRYGRGYLAAQYGRSLFRSLEVAYSACAVGAKNQGSIHDYGLQVALWVSAIEILAWPRNDHANLEYVLAFLRSAPLHETLARRRFRATMKKREGPIPMNALERAYSYLYTARNQFLHGNPVSPSILFTRSRKQQVPIPRVAAVVYRMALAAYLNDRYPVAIRSMEELKARPGEVGLRHTYETALAEMFGIDLKGKK